MKQINQRTEMEKAPKKVILPKDVTDSLRNVMFPGTDKDIVSLDMVQEIRITGKEVQFSLVFQRSDDPNIGQLVDRCEKAITEYLGSDVKIGGNIKVKSVHNMQRPLLPGVKNIIAVASGKGGVGKSTVAVNLAVALARRGLSVGLIDADIFGPSIPRMFGAEGTKPGGGRIEGRDVIIPVEKFGVKFLSIGFFVAAENALIWRGPMASNALKQLIADGLWGTLDYMIVDLPPGTSDIHLTLVQTVPVTAAVIVTTPQDVALADVVKGVSMFQSKSIDVPVLGLIENMSWFTPEELPQNRYYLFGKDGGKRLADKLGLVLLGQIPLVQGIREGGDEGVPVASISNNIIGSAFSDIAEAVVFQMEKRNSGKAPTTKVHVHRK